MAEMLVRHQKGGQRRARQFTWVPADFLAEQKVRPWSNMPVWMPDRSGQRRVLAPENRQGARGRSDLPSARRHRERTLEWNKTRPEAELQALAEGRRAGISARVKRKSSRPGKRSRNRRDRSGRRATERGRAASRAVATRGGRSTRRSSRAAHVVRVLLLSAEQLLRAAADSRRGRRGVGRRATCRGCLRARSPSR